MGRDYRDLIAWQKGMALVEEVYQATRAFPREETYALTNQVRRAAVSVPTNVAEGQGRGTDPDFVRFLWIAHASVREVETLVLIAGRLGYLDPAPVNRLIDRTSEVGRIIMGLIKARRGRGPE